MSGRLQQAAWSTCGHRKVGVPERQPRPPRRCTAHRKGATTAPSSCTGGEGGIVRLTAHPSPGARDQRRCATLSFGTLTRASSNPVGSSTRPLPQYMAKGPQRPLLHVLAERVGFEPTNTFWVLLKFQSSAFDHSATSPKRAANLTPRPVQRVVLASPARLRIPRYARDRRPPRGAQAYRRPQQAATGRGHPFSGVRLGK